MTDPIRNREFRKWIDDITRSGCTIRDEAVRTGFSALLHRLSNFGFEWLLETLTARELLTLILFTQGPTAYLFLRAAFTRAIIEQDYELINGIQPFPILDDAKEWLSHHLVNDPDEAAAILAAHQGHDDAERKAVGRILIGRQFPHLAQLSWLTDGQGVPAIIRYHLASVLLRTPSVAKADIATYLLENPQVLTVDNPDSLIAAMIRAGDNDPIRILEQFQGYVADEAIVACGEWFLEQHKPQQAIGAARQIRFLSEHWPRAQLIIGLAHIEGGKHETALTVLNQLDQGPEWRQLVLALTPTSPGISVDQLLTVAHSCTPQEPETFFKAIELLVRSGKLEDARAVLRTRHEAFSSFAPIQQLVKVLN